MYASVSGLSLIAWTQILNEIAGSNKFYILQGLII